MNSASPDDGQTSRFHHFCLVPAERFLSFTGRRAYPARFTFFSQGDAVEDVIYLERGLVKLVCTHAGGEERIVGLRADGWIFGAEAAILGEPYVTTAISVVPSVIGRMGVSEFRQRLRADGTLSTEILRMHAREVYAELTQSAAASTSARSRLEHLLLNLAPPSSQDDSGEVRVHVPLRQWEVAQLIGVAAPYLCHLMAQLEADGVLRRERGAIVLNLSRAACPMDGRRSRLGL